MNEEKMIYKLNKIQDEINKLENNIKNIRNNKENIAIYEYWCSGYSSNERYTKLLDIDLELQNIIIDKLQKEKEDLKKQRTECINILYKNELGEVNNE